MTALFPVLKSEATSGGIGLDTCKQIMNGHQGEIKVYSIPKQGTVFTGSIPQPSEIHHVNNDLGTMLSAVREDTLD